MCDMEVVLKVEGLSKTYFSEQQSNRSIKDLFSDPFMKNTGEASRIEALKDISFELKKGESLGIVGSNGAGKSTLLKILSGVTAPTSGKVTINGRVLSVLDIGTGFHPDLTGKENVYLSGEILGMSRSEIDEKYKEIVDFSGIGDFVNRPVKHYSSGMYLRLAFSTMIFMEADLLILDEAISSGDEEFKRKMLKRTQLQRKKGVTMIIVSHNLSEVYKLCTRVILLDEGGIKNSGSPTDVLGSYIEEAVTKSLETNEKARIVKTPDSTGASKITIYERYWASIDDAPKHSTISLTYASVFSENRGVGFPISIDQPAVLIIRIRKDGDEHIDLGISVADIRYNPIFAFSSIINKVSNQFAAPGEYELRFEIPANIFNKGHFIVGVVFFEASGKMTVLHEDILIFETQYPPLQKDTDLMRQFPGPLKFNLPCSVTEINQSL
jgi:ABC-type polysaccharide/polyol phosphate transport system ATPase subunit